MIKFENVSKYEEQDVKMPKRATAKSAGYDIYNNGPEIKVLPRMYSEPISTKLKVCMNDDMVLKIYPRSGHGFKFGVGLANTVGIIDADYYNNEKNEGEVFIKIYNPSNDYFVVKSGEAMAQGIFEKYYLVEGDSYGEGNVRDGGFGSTT
jgi:dUTP pyrophosphatase